MEEEDFEEEDTTTRLQMAPSIQDVMQADHRHMDLQLQIGKQHHFDSDS
jgi:hypothetical protein